MATGFAKSFQILDLGLVLHDVVGVRLAIGRIVYVLDRS
jgi:hypothetical protein